ncbi:MAG: hypothetical protein JF632_04200 [Acidobacteria bacterium]|nr:hypothetical protein [Acidobacteriota bacterium]
MIYRSLRPASLVRAAVVFTALMLATDFADAADSVLYRLFLQDGTSIISYGEFARVAGRVVLSIPLGDSAQSPTLQLISIPEASVDWQRTDRYSQAVRAKRYGETRGENDFAMLSARVTEALNQIALTPDPTRRLAMAVEARGNLARWPLENFGYRATDVSQLVGMLDEVISELRVAAGQSNFDLSLVANVAVPTPEELLPEPSFQESMEQAVAAAGAAAEPVERISLLDAVSAALLEPARAGGWAAALRTRVTTELAAERRIDSAYQALSSTTIASAAARAQRGDVPGVQALIQSVLKADDRLGRRRPQETTALLQMMDLRLDEARRVRLARDAWIVRSDSYRDYRAAIAPALAEFRSSGRLLESIRQLAGPEPRLLPHLEQRLVMARQQLAAITPPPDLQAVHALLTSTFQMAGRAVSSRRNAVSSGNLSLAWEASSAAAGALMLFQNAGDELDRLTTPPSNR